MGVKFIEKPAGRQTASPLLVNDHLIVHLNHLLAIDAQTGEIVWQDGRIRVPSVDGLAPGTEVTAVIRPERISVARLAHGEPAPDDGYDAQVLERTFLGPTTRLKVRVGGADLTVEVGAEGTALRVGDRVGLTIDGSACFIMR